jgi:DNA-binding response OmpR family regulator
MRIIIVEQDAALGLFLRKGLAVEGHDVSWSDCPFQALDMVERSAPELIVLDVSTERGMDLLGSLRQSHHRVAVLALTQGTAIEDRVQCLDLGADDCMVKPFSFQELTARCRALLRRQTRASEGEVVLAHGTLCLNRVSRSVSVAGRLVSLTVKEFRLLEFLLQNAGRCCSRSELLTEVFHLPAVNATNVVDVYINYLRKKLTCGEETPQIVTVRGAGYRFAREERVRVQPMTQPMGDLHVSA